MTSHKIRHQGSSRSNCHQDDMLPWRTTYHAFFGSRLYRVLFFVLSLHEIYPDSNVHGDNMGPIWGRQDQGGSHVGPMNFTIWLVLYCASLWRDPVAHIELIYSNTASFRIMVDIFSKCTIKAHSSPMGARYRPSLFGPSPELRGLAFILIWMS